MSRWKVRLKLMVETIHYYKELPFAENVIFTSVSVSAKEHGAVYGWAIVEDGEEFFYENFETPVKFPDGGSFNVDFTKFNFCGVPIIEILRGKNYRQITDPWEPQW